MAFSVFEWCVFTIALIFYTIRMSQDDDTKPLRFPSLKTDLCPLVPPNLKGPINVSLDEVSLSDLEQNIYYLEPGAKFRPKTCISRHKVAIIIPFMNREEHLPKLLANLIPVITRQQIDFGIFLVEPVQNSTFNRGKLMNIGVSEALRQYNWTCFIFHDVDLVPENDWILYNCPDTPRHLSVAIDKYNYKLISEGYVGGVTNLNYNDFFELNGFSNHYWGWGGEDDDLYIRIKSAQKFVERRSDQISRYKMLYHGRDKQNPVNPCRFKLLKTAESRWRKEGYNTLTYTLFSKEEKPLFTHVVVNLEEKTSKTDEVFRFC